MLNLNINEQGKSQDKMDHFYNQFCFLFLMLLLVSLELTLNYNPNRQKTLIYSTIIKKSH